MSEFWTEEKLNDYLDGRLTEVKRAHVEAHLSQHPADAETLREFQQLRAAIQTAPRYRLGHDFPQQVIATIRQRSGETALVAPASTGNKSGLYGSWRLAAAAITALAASLVLIVVMTPSQIPSDIAKMEPGQPSAESLSESPESQPAMTVVPNKSSAEFMEGEGIASVDQFLDEQDAAPADQPEQTKFGDRTAEHGLSAGGGGLGGGGRESGGFVGDAEKNARQVIDAQKKLARDETESSLDLAEADRAKTDGRDGQPMPHDALEDDRMQQLAQEDAISSSSLATQAGDVGQDVGQDLVESLDGLFQVDVSRQQVVLVELSQPALADANVKQMLGKAGQDFAPGNAIQSRIDQVGDADPDTRLIASLNLAANQAYRAGDVSVLQVEGTESEINQLLRQLGGRQWRYVDPEQQPSITEQPAGAAGIGLPQPAEPVQTANEIQRADVRALVPVLTDTAEGEPNDPPLLANEMLRDAVPGQSRPAAAAGDDQSAAADFRSRRQFEREGGAEGKLDPSSAAAAEAKQFKAEVREQRNETAKKQDADAAPAAQSQFQQLNRPGRSLESNSKQASAPPADARRELKSTDLKTAELEKADLEMADPKTAEFESAKSDVARHLSQSNQRKSYLLILRIVPEQGVLKSTANSAAEQAAATEAKPALEKQRDQQRDKK